VGVTNAGSRRLRRGILALVATVVAGACLPGGARAASYATGLDVSHYQGAIGWIQVASGGYSFVFAKATEGMTLIDPTYSINRAGADGVGLKIGAYHFGRPGGSGVGGIAANAIAQADFFISVAQPAAGDLPPVLDLEATGGLSPTSLIEWTQTWLGEVYALTGIEPAVYVSPDFWKTNLSDTTALAAGGVRLWIANWTTKAAPLMPAANWGGLGWTFWQWSDCQAVPGIAHCVDGDRFNGPSAAAVAVPALPQGAPAVSSAPTVAGTPQSGLKLAGIPGIWTGGKPVSFTYQWQSCDAAGFTCTPIIGATLETYTPSATDVGHALELTVTASTTGGTATATSAPTLAIAPAGASASARPSAIVAPTVTGTPQVGTVLTASAGTWTGSPTSYAFIWRRCDATGANCASIANAVGTTYTLTPGDIGSTISLAVTATGKGGAQTATAVTTAVIAPAPVPPAVPGPAQVVAGQAGAVVTSDGRATVTWQPGAIPVGANVALSPVDGGLTLAGTGVVLDIEPPASPLPWPVDLAYAAAPSGQTVGFSLDGTIWVAVPPLTSPALPVGLEDGTYEDGSVLHVLTEVAGHYAVFTAGAWGDPARVSRGQPVLARAEPVKATRRASDHSILLVTRLTVSSQADLFVNAYGPGGARPVFLPRGTRLGLPLHGSAAKTEHVRLLAPGSFPVQLRISGRGIAPGKTGSVRVTAIDPWGRRAQFVLGFKAP